MDRYKGSQSKKSISVYLDFLELLKENGHELKSEYIKSNIKVLIDFKCGHEPHWLIPNSYKNGRGCPSCNSSKGEERIAKYLDENGIVYIRQYKFDNLALLKSLRFDFYIPHKDIYIEYDGQQHFEPVDFANRGAMFADEEFEKVKERDALKNKYCTENGINLIRIPYWEYENIETILEKEII